jgi:formate dehydrogenase beta subunit
MTTVNIPPCQAACPIRTDVRGYVAAIAKGDAEEALRIIRQVNPLPSVCGRICTRLCEKACRRAQLDKSVSIRALKRFAADRAKGIKHVERPLNSYEEKIAVIGSGPAGLTAAHDLALLGYKVTLFEAQKVLGGLLSAGIPDYRLPKKMVKKDIDDILSLGVQAKTGMSLGRDFTVEGLLKEYQAVFLAVGSQKSLIPKCTGSDLPGVMAGVDFLKQVSKGKPFHPGERVIVIGGGHTAIDAARTCVRLGCPDVTIVYRRTLEEMPAGREEVEEAEEEGIKLIYLAAPIEFSGNGKVKSVKFIRMELGEPDKSGRRRPVPVEGSEFEMKADAVILAIGYAADAEALAKDGLEIGKRGTIAVKDAGGMTNIKGVFAAGDVVSGPLSVIEAMASGRKAAHEIHRYLRNLSNEEKEESVELGSINDKISGLISPAERQKMPVCSVEERVRNFEEVELGYSREQAVREALRCLNCGTGASIADNCASCLNCVRICPYGIPVPGKETVEIDISQCQACGICATECPASAIKLNIETKAESRAELEKVIDAAREESPEILVIGFYCRYGSPLGAPFEENEVYWIPKLCTGRINESLLLYAFELGADGAIVHMCGDDGECRFRDASRRLGKHIRDAQKILSATGMGPDRLGIVSNQDDYPGFREKLGTLNINPLRRGKKVKI